MWSSFWGGVAKGSGTNNSYSAQGFEDGRAVAQRNLDERVGNTSQDHFKNFGSAASRIGVYEYEGRSPPSSPRSGGSRNDSADYSGQSEPYREQQEREKYSFGGNVASLGMHATEAVLDARSGNWAGAAANSARVAGDVAEIVPEVVDAYVEARTDAVQGGYSQYSDIGFQ